MINDFIAAIKTTGLARSNIFEVQFNLPTLLKSKRPSSNLQKLLMYCESTSLPGVTISTNQIRTFGEIRETPYEKLYDNIQLSFYIDNTFEIKSLFDDWADIIQNNNTRNFNYYKEYTTDIIIKILDKNNQARYEVTLYESYIKNIQPIQLDYGSKEIAKLVVTINYKYWKKTENGVSNNINSFINGFSAFSDSIQIPSDYFKSFSDFQGKFNTYTASDLSPNQYLDNINIVSGIRPDIPVVINSIKGNLPKDGDNLIFDFIG